MNKRSLEILNGNIAKPIVKRSLSSELLLIRIDMYKQRLSEAKISDREFKSMAKALFGVKMIIADLLIDNDA